LIANAALSYLAPGVIRAFSCRAASHRANADPAVAPEQRPAARLAGVAHPEALAMISRKTTHKKDHTPENNIAKSEK
jgi:hypothetical protein